MATVRPSGAESEKRFGSFMFWVFEERFGRFFFDVFSTIHENDPVSNCGGETHFVRDHPHRRAALCQFDHHVQYLLDHFRIKSRSGVVKQHDPRAHP